MLLTVDIGNTSITLGLFEGERFVNEFRLASDKDLAQEEYEILLKSLLKEYIIDGCIVSSVVEELTQKIKSAIDNVFGISSLILTSDINTGVKICIDKPEEAGADRIANACGAYLMYGNSEGRKSGGQEVWQLNGNSPRPLRERPASRVRRFECERMEFLKHSTIDTFNASRSRQREEFVSEQSELTNSGEGLAEVNKAGGLEDKPVSEDWKSGGQEVWQLNGNSPRPLREREEFVSEQSELTNSGEGSVEGWRSGGIEVWQLSDEQKFGGQKIKPVSCHCEEGDSPTWQSIDNDSKKAGLLSLAHNDDNNICASNDAPYNSTPQPSEIPPSPQPSPSRGEGACNDSFSTIQPFNLSTNNQIAQQVRNDRYLFNDTDLSPYRPIALSPDNDTENFMSELQSRPTEELSPDTSLPPSNAIIVVDFGTATTFDIVNSKGEFIGGIISLGIMSQLKALNKFTSKLPKTDVSIPQNAIGHNTNDAILSGVIRGTASMIDGMIEQCEKELGEKAIVVATGGYSGLIANYLKRKFDYINPILTLEGLRLLYILNYVKDADFVV